MSKYDALTQFLRHQAGPVEYPLSRLNQIVSGGLPASAFQYEACGATTTLRTTTADPGQRPVLVLIRIWPARSSASNFWSERGEVAVPASGPANQPARSLEAGIGAAGQLADRNFHNLDSLAAWVSHRDMTSDYVDVIDELRVMRERVRSIRTRHCEPRSNTNPRYLALSNVVSNLSKAMDDMEVAGRPS